MLEGLVAQGRACHALARVLIEKPSVIAVDTETTGLEFYDYPFCATISFRGRRGIENHYISLEGEGEGGRKALLSNLLRLVPTWLFHNAKFDLQKLLLVGVITPQDVEEKLIHDTSVIYHLLDENQPKGLKHLARTILGEETDEEEQLAKVRRKLKLKKADGYFLIPRRYIIPYALKDTEFTLRLFEKSWPQLQSRGDGILDVYTLELDVMRVLLRMEANGLKLDLDFLKSATSDYGVRVMEGWQRIVELTSAEFNPQSPAQLIEAFAARGVLLESTGESVLKGVEDELAAAVLQYRQDKKIHTTYLQGLLKEQRDGKVHPYFNSTGAGTGRMSSGKVAA